MTTVFDGIIFMEEACPAEYETGKKCGSDIFLVRAAQLRSLYDVKRWLAEEAKKAECNCVYNFKYGQRTYPLFLNNVFFYGTGMLAILPENMYNDLILMHKK